MSIIIIPMSKKVHTIVDINSLIHFTHIYKRFVTKLQCESKFIEANKINNTWQFDLML